MPIYAYKCETCGHAKDVLQKMSDSPLSECPACGAGTFRKQLTAAGFQLKGSGWYVTDFRNGNEKAPAAKPDEKAATAGESADSKTAPVADGAAPAKPEAPASAAPAPAPTAPAATPASSTATPKST